MKYEEPMVDVNNPLSHVQRYRSKNVIGTNPFAEKSQIPFLKQ